MNTPTISIIIAVYNGAATIKHCLDSVLNQKSDIFELIVIDGGSTDKTVNILGSYADSRLQWVSEPDNGIFDAWNKGVLRTTGEWIMFLGSDDYLASDNVLKDLNHFIRRLKLPLDFITVRNHTIIDGEMGNLWGEPWEWKKFRRYMHICHVGTLHHADYFKRYGLFDTSLKIAGDYEMLLRSGKYLKTIDFPFNVAFCGEEGVSRTQIGKVCIESIKVQQKHNCSNLLYSAVRYVYTYLKHQIINII